MDPIEMVTTSFSDEMARKGAELLKELDARHVDVDAAFWYYYPEEGFWKLMLSLPSVEKEGPKAAYALIQQALAKIAEEDRLRLDDVAVSKPNAPLLNLLKVMIRTDKGISGLRFTNNVINGHLISDAYVYRVN